MARFSIKAVSLGAILSILQRAACLPSEYQGQVSDSHALRFVASRQSSDPRNHTECRSFPGDAAWPTTDEWASFNTSLEGKLIATVPLASACHDDIFTTYDAGKCAALQNIWQLSTTHEESISTVMAPYFNNRSCDPYTPKDYHCIVGTSVQYAVKASSPSDFRAAILWATKHNVRLVIRNTDHDYYGKSTGAGALAIWTHFLREKSVVPHYIATSVYAGAAIKFGAGIETLEAFEFAHENGLIVVGGNCPTVGIAGGYSQGGGHGPTASKFGLAADQVLEWEVVTADGVLRKASPVENEDLYWALSGGGGGTFGVVYSMTVKAYPDVSTVLANLTFTSTGISLDDFYNASSTFLTNLPALVDSGISTIWTLEEELLDVSTIMAPGLTTTEVTALLSPTLETLNSSGIQYAYSVSELPTFLEAYLASSPNDNITWYQIGGRLIPRSLIQSNATSVIQAYRNINSNGGVISGVGINVPLESAAPANAVNPVWRSAIISNVIGLPWNDTDWALNIANQALIKQTLVPQLEAITPHGGAYLNEADWQQADFQSTFYGSNYGNLTAIKRKYDPDHVFYGLTAVGSEYWVEESDGRLCRKIN